MTWQTPKETIIHTEMWCVMQMKYDIFCIYTENKKFRRPPSSKKHGKILWLGSLVLNPYNFTNWAFLRYICGLQIHIVQPWTNLFSAQCLSASFPPACQSCTQWAVQWFYTTVTVNGFHVMCECWEFHIQPALFFITPAGFVTALPLASSCLYIPP